MWPFKRNAKPKVEPPKDIVFKLTLDQTRYVASLLDACNKCPDEQHYRAKFDLWSYIDSVIGDAKPVGDYKVTINTRSSTQYSIVYKKE